MAKALSSKQKDILVDFVYDRPEMYKGKFTSTYTHAVSMALWKQVASILNAIPGGANKEWTQWRKTWVDLKKQVKNKKSKEKQHSYGTGGGPPLPPPLEDGDKTTDEKIFEIITPVAFEGNRDVPEPQIVFEEFSIPADKNTAAIDTNNLMDTEDATSIAGTSGLSGTSKMLVADANLDTTPSRSTGTRKKITKSGKLEQSLRNNQNFLAISQKGIQSTDSYRERKLQIMKRNADNKENYYKAKIEAVKSYYNNKKHYNNEKNQVLKSISDSVGQMAADINNLQEMLS